MRIISKRVFGQLSLIIVLCAVSLSCNANREEIPVIPPVTSPLTGGYIGFGVITSSFTHITLDPSENSDSLGYLRRGSLVKVIRRQVIKAADGFVSWVFVDGERETASGDPSGEIQSGWLKEDVLEIYANESQARTASESIIR